MFCPNCGKEGTGKFCSECGTPLGSTPIQPEKAKEGFWAELKGQVGQLAEDGARYAEARRQEKQEEKARLKQMDKEGIPYCPKCHSTSLSANKKGFGFGKAAMGALIAPIGIAAGGIGSGKVRLTCLKCGHQFKPGQKR